MSNKEINQELSQTRNDISPEIDNEKNKEKIEENQSIDEAIESEQVVKDSKEIKYTSALLFFFFFSSIIFMFLFSIALPWGLVLLIFLGPSLICFLIATFLTRVGMTNGRKGLLYASSGIYLISALFAGDPDWQLFQIAPFVFAVLVLVGTLIAKEEKR